MRMRTRWESKGLPPGGRSTRHERLLRTAGRTERVKEEVVEERVHRVLGAVRLVLQGREDQRWREVQLEPLEDGVLRNPVAREVRDGMCVRGFEAAGRGAAGVPLPTPPRPLRLPRGQPAPDVQAPRHPGPAARVPAPPPPERPGAAPARALSA